MSRITTKIVELDNGEGTVSVPPSRLVAVEGIGGTVGFVNRGNFFAAGDNLEPDEDFVAGRCIVYGTPGSTARLFFRF